MSDDIVTHLRQMAARERDDRAECDLYIAENFQEAADEIERLRAFADDLETAADGERVRLTRQILALEMGTNNEL